MDDVSQRRKLLRDSEIGHYSSLFILAPQLRKEKQPSPNRLLLVCCQAVPGILVPTWKEVFMQSVIIQCVGTNAGHSYQAHGLEFRGCGKASSPRRSLRNSQGKWDYMGADIYRRIG